MLRTKANGDGSRNEQEAKTSVAADSCLIGKVVAGVLERCEGLVRLEALAQLFGGLRVETVAAKTAKESRMDVVRGVSRKRAL